MTRRALLLSAALGLLSTEPPAPERFSLDGGAELVVFPVPDAPAVALVAAVRLDSDEEPHEGMAALLTRLLGAEAEGRSANQIQRDISGFGAVGTDYDGSVLSVWAVSDPEGVGEAARTLIVNLLGQPLFTPEAVKAARQEQVRELLFERDSLLPGTLAALRARVLDGFSSPLGSEDSLSAINPMKLTAFHRRYIRPDRTTFVAVGRVPPAELKEIVRACLGASGWLDGPASPPPPRREPLGPLPMLRDRALPRRAPAQAVALGLRLPGAAALAGEYPALLLLEAAVGGGKGARLFSLRDSKSLGYETQAAFLPGHRASLFAAYVLGDVPVEQVRGPLREAIAAPGNGQRPFTEAELERARSYVKGQRLRLRQRLVARARSAARLASLKLGAETDATLDARLESVTLAELNGLARKYLSQNAAIVYTLPPDTMPA